MMETGTSNKWINLSVFFEKSCWSTIISEFFEPYITENRLNGRIGYFSFSFSTEQGQHIRLAVESISNDQLAFAVDLHDNISKYLLARPSPSPDQNYIGKAFFMDHYNNSIQYELYQIDTVHEKVNELRTLVSDLFLRFFGENEHDDSSLFIFTMYIVMAICQAWATFHNANLSAGITELLNANCENQIPLDIKFETYHELFMDNKEMIVKMYADVIESDLEQDIDMELHALKTNYAAMLNKAKDTAGFTECYHLPLDTVIMDCVGMKHDSLAAMYYIIHLCVNEMLRV